METTINTFQLTALLHDTITHLKFKQHIAPNYKSAKTAFCNAKGIKSNVSSWVLLTHIGQVYKDNDMLNKFMSTCTKLGYPIDLN